MGRVFRAGRKLLSGLESVAKYAERYDALEQQVLKINGLKSDISIADSIGTAIANTLRLLTIVCGCMLLHFVGVCVGEVYSKPAHTYMEFWSSMAYPLGFGMVFLVVAQLLFTVARILEQATIAKDLQIQREESILRRQVFRLGIFVLADMCNWAAPDRLSLEDYAGSVVNTIDVLCKVANPVIAIMFSGWRSWFVFSSSVHFFNSAKDRIFNWVRSVYTRIAGSSRRQLCAAAGALTSIAAAFYLYRRFSTINSETSQCRVVQKKRQHIFDQVPELTPCDPSELSGIDCNVVPTRTFPDAPSFSGFELVRNSLATIYGGYGATCFRVGQNLITAGHCVAKRTNSKTGKIEYGIPVHNPDDKKQYWAPLEKYFDCKDAPLADGIAICSLPNSDFFLQMSSASIRVPSRSMTHAMSFRTVNWDDKPKFNISVGPCSVKGDVLEFKSSVEAGSSGGPIMNTDGAVVAIVHGHSYESNYGLCITQEIVDFLTKAGGAASASSGIHLRDRCGTGSIKTEQSRQLPKSTGKTSNQDGHGQEQTDYESDENCSSSTGATNAECADTEKPKKKGRARRKQHPSNPPQPPSPEDHIES